jgi:hypothetical protein
MKHAPPQMRNTFAKLADYMQRESSHQFVPGRSSKYSVPDVMTKGFIDLKKTLKAETSRASQWVDVTTEDGNLPLLDGESLEVEDDTLDDDIIDLETT